MDVRPTTRLISGEILVSLLGLSYAISALNPESPLARTLLHREGILGVVIWSIMMGGPALVGAIFGCKQWASGSTIDSAKFRSRLMLFQLYGWLYAVHLVMDTGKYFSAFAMHALIASVFCFWSYTRNRVLRHDYAAQARLQS